MRKLRLPGALVFVAAAVACGDDSKPVTADAAPSAVDANSCFYECIVDQYSDDGGPIRPGYQCPDCATGAAHDCGPNCIAVPTT